MGFGKEFCAALVLGGCLIGSAQASSVSYFLDETNTISPYLTQGQDYLEVTIDDQGSPGLINFTVQTLQTLNNIAGSNFGMQEFGLNALNIGSLSASNIVNLPSAWSASVGAGASTLDGFGKFDVDVSNGGGARLSTLTFSINTGTVADYVKLSSGTAGVNNVDFAAHVGGFNDGFGNTGAYFGGSTPVPVPAALWLFGSGLMGLLGIIRRYHKSQ